MREAFHMTTSSESVDLASVEDGDAAMDYLRKNEPFQKAAPPDLIILDLNLPKKHGAELLAEIKSDNLFRTIPVAILSSSRSPSDIRSCYEHNANCYLTKPSDYPELLKLVRSLNDFWLSNVQYSN
jgi:two-component system response regulator